MYLTNFSLLFKTSYLIFIIPTILVIISAMMSAKEMGGTLGQGLKKIVFGSIIDTVLIMTYFLLENGNRGLLSGKAIKIFFMVSGLIGSTFLIIGYLQIYKVAKNLKLFTV